MEIDIIYIQLMNFVRKLDTPIFWLKKLNFMNSQHENINWNDDLYLKPVLIV